MQVLAVAEPAVREKFAAFKHALVEKVQAKDAALQTTLRKEGRQIAAD